MVAVIRCRRLNRRDLRIFKAHASLPRRRQAEKEQAPDRDRLATRHKRARKTQAEIRQPISAIRLLKLVYQPDLSTAIREQLAALLPSFATRGKQWKEHARLSRKNKICIRKGIWTRLPVETNPKIWKPLMRLGDGIFDWPYTWLGREVSAVRFVIRVLGPNTVPMRFDEREAAWRILADAMHLNFFEPVGEDLFLAMWMHLVEMHGNPYPFSDGLWRSALRVARTAVRPICQLPRVDPQRVAKILAAHRPTTDFLLQTLTSDLSLLRGPIDDDVGPITWPCRLRGAIVWLILGLLDALPPAHRSSLIAHYRPYLQLALSVMHPFHISLLTVHEEILAIVATTPSVLQHVWESGARHECEGSPYCPHGDPVNLILSAMQHALNDGPRLQAMLGDGFLAIAEHYASDEYDVTTTNADVFRQILAVRPEFRRKFKKLTENGIVSNEVASLGRSLSERVPKEGINYIIEKEGLDEL